MGSGTCQASRTTLVLSSGPTSGEKRETTPPQPPHVRHDVGGLHTCNLAPVPSPSPIIYPHMLIINKNDEYAIQFKEKPYEIWSFVEITRDRNCEERLDERRLGFCVKMDPPQNYTPSFYFFNPLLEFKNLLSQKGLQTFPNPVSRLGPPDVFSKLFILLKIYLHQVQIEYFLHS